MTDALARLVRRTLRPETVLQPRLPSPFERRLPGAEAAWLELREAPAEPASPPMERERDADTAGPATAGASPPRRTTAETDLVIPHVQPRSRPRPTESAEPLTQPHPTIRVAEPEPAPAAQGLARPARVVAPGPDGAPERTSAAAARTAAVAGPGRVPPLVPPSPSVERSADRAARTPEVLPLPPPRDPDADGHADPVIHITIGRVEVRANVTPGPVRSPDPRPPAVRRVMPLDEYLDRRARGGGA
jgi:hypothetical protein